MTEHVTPNDDGPGYQLRVAEHLDDHWSAWFDGMTLSHEDDGTTVLRGTVIDQAELHGLLAKVRDLGATLISVTSTNSGRDAPATDRDVAGPRRTTAREASDLRVGPDSTQRDCSGDPL